MTNKFNFREIDSMAMMYPKIESARNRISDQVFNFLETSDARGYLFDLMNAIIDVDDLNNPTKDWDKDLVTKYSLKPFNKGKLNQLGLWHGHSPLHGYADFAANNARKKLPAFMDDLKSFNLTNSLNEQTIDKAINKWLSSVTGVGGEQEGRLTSHYLIFKRREGLDYFLAVCEHLPSGDLGDELADYVYEKNSNALPFLFN